MFRSAQVFVALGWGWAASNEFSFSRAVEHKRGSRIYIDHVSCTIQILKHRESDSPPVKQPSMVRVATHTAAL